VNQEALSTTTAYLEPKYAYPAPSRAISRAIFTRRKIFDYGQNRDFGS